MDAYVLPNGDVSLNPSEKLVSEYFEKITSYWEEYVRTFQNYLHDETLQIFVQPTIMGKQVDWSAGSSPSLYFLMNQDNSMLEDIEFIPYAVKHAYECVWTFLNRMQYFMDGFREAVEMDVDLIRNERDVAVFRKLADRFNKQIEDIEEVVSYQPLGMIFLCLLPFQELFRPQPRKLLDVIVSTTPE